MNKQTVFDERTSQSYTVVHHPSGLDVMVMEMPDFTSAVAAFATKYGSVNTEYRLNDGTLCRDPLGIAHFLEHKLFENEDCDAFKLYAETGANANAYTSFDKTVYLFDCSANFRPSLEILLNFVTHPYFTDESVAKEQGIIKQEILMCEDNPFRRVYFNLLQAVYKNNPIRYEIAGTVDSIAEISKDMLYRAYNSFYDLSNMVLCCAGNCKLDDVLEACDKFLKPCSNNAPKLILPNEPNTVYKPLIKENMSVGLPLFSVGYKVCPDTGESLCKKEYISAFLLDMIFGQTSRFYAEYSAKGLINSSFETETTSGNGFLVNALSGESKDPHAVYNAMNDELVRVKKEGLDESEFLAYKKTAYGAIVRELNSVGACNSMMLESHMRGYSAFAPSKILASLTFEETLSMLDMLLDPKTSALSVIEP